MKDPAYMELLELTETIESAKKVIYVNKFYSKAYSVSGSDISC